MFIVPVAVLMMMVVAAVSYTAWWSHPASQTLAPRGGQHTADETFAETSALHP